MDRERFAGDKRAELAELATSQSPDEYAKSVKQAIDDAQSDAGIGKLERRKRAKRFRTWWDKVTGMLPLSGQIDPETGMQFAAKLGAEVEQMFHGHTPEGCPEDPSAKQDCLMVLALVQLVRGHTTHADGGGDGGAMPETGTNADFVVVIGLETLQRGRDAGSIIDLNDPETFLPVETLRRMACLANIIPAVMDSNGVVLDMGYSARLATKAQRRAMRAMYPSCGVPGCRVPFERCAIHHIRYWEDFGTSDMATMIPLCSKHHHAAHEGGWHLALDPVTRALTITYPDGSRHTSAAPRATAPAV